MNYKKIFSLFGLLVVPLVFVFCTSFNSNTENQKSEILLANEGELGKMAQDALWNSLKGDTAMMVEYIHRKVLTLDSHVDTPLRLLRGAFDLSKRNDARQGGGKLDFPRMEEGGLDAVFFAVFLGQGALNDQAYDVALRCTLEIFETIEKALAKTTDLAGLALTPEDAYKLKSKGKRAVFIGVENAYPLGNDLGLVEKFYDLGARYIGLSHTANNQVCDSSTDNSGPLHDGLSEFGKEVVKRMNQLGMMIDVSHISDKAFFDVLEISTLPVIASHSNARAVCNHPRNLSDKMLVALAQNGGVVQVCVLSAYIKMMPPNPEREQAMTELRVRHNNFQDLTDEQMEVARREWFETDREFPAPMATVADLVDHIDHIVKVAGIDHIGIGTDFDGGGALKDCYDVSELKNITRELIKRDYSFEDIKKIWGENFMRVFEENQRAANFY